MASAKFMAAMVPTMQTEPLITRTPVDRALVELEIPKGYRIATESEVKSSFESSKNFEAQLDTFGPVWVKTAAGKISIMGLVGGNGGYLIKEYTEAVKVARVSCVREESSRLKRQ